MIRWTTAVGGVTTTWPRNPMQTADTDWYDASPRTETYAKDGTFYEFKSGRPRWVRDVQLGRVPRTFRDYIFGLFDTPLDIILTDHTGTAWSVRLKGSAFPKPTRQQGPRDEWDINLTILRRS